MSIVIFDLVHCLITLPLSCVLTKKHFTDQKIKQQVLNGGWFQQISLKTNVYGLNSCDQAVGEKTQQRRNFITHTSTTDKNNHQHFTLLVYHK